MTSAQRYNAKMNKLFEDAKVNHAKYAPLHAVQILRKLTDKVENVVNHRAVTENDLVELNLIARTSRSVLEALPANFVPAMQNTDLASLMFDRIRKYKKDCD